MILHQDNAGLFNNVAQSWNHDFYWRCMKPDGGGEPRGLLADAIKKDFSSLDKMVDEMETAALTAFGSGWAWLSYDKKRQKLVVTKTSGRPVVSLLYFDFFIRSYCSFACMFLFRCGQSIDRWISSYLDN